MASPRLAPTARVNLLTGIIITAAMKVHSLLGPGLLESAYEACLVHELRKQGLEVRNQVVLPVVYDGTTSTSVTVSICWLRSRLLSN